jgi:hypothetical protein
MTAPPLPPSAPPTHAPDPGELASITLTTETLWRTYGAINEWIRFADAKAGAILTVNGVLGGALVTALGGNKDFLVAHLFTFGAVVLSLACIVTSTIHCLRCIQPSLKADPATSLLYFGHISHQFRGNSRDYTDALRKKLASPLDAMHEIGDQVWVNAHVATSKNRKIVRGIQFLGLGLGFGLLACVIAFWGK